jgi:hypothetical protein
MAEKNIEKYLTEQIREGGGRTLKLEGQGKGKLDRLVLMPGGRMAFVELKTDTGKNVISVHQRRFIFDMRDLGFAAWICSSKPNVDELIKYLTTIQTSR